MKLCDSGDAVSSPGRIASAIGLYRDGVRVACATLGDRLREDSVSSVRALKNLGLEVCLLSGDAESPVDEVARALSISHPVSKATPEVKGRVAASRPFGLMVGDGANDAVALASAYAGFAVSGGVEMSMKAAGAYAAKPGIGSVVEAIRIARSAMRVIHRNLGFAIAYNVIAITVALSGHLNPIFAAVLMPMSAGTLFFATLLGMRAPRRGVK